MAGFFISRLNGILSGTTLSIGGDEEVAPASISLNLLRDTEPGVATATMKVISLARIFSGANIGI